MCLLFINPMVTAEIVHSLLCEDNLVGSQELWTMFVIGIQFLYVSESDIVKTEENIWYSQADQGHLEIPLLQACQLENSGCVRNIGKYLKPNVWDGVMVVVIRWFRQFPVHSRNVSRYWCEDWISVKIITIIV